MAWKKSAVALRVREIVKEDPEINSLELNKKLLSEGSTLNTSQLRGHFARARTELGLIHKSTRLSPTGLPLKMKTKRCTHTKRSKSRDALRAREVVKEDPEISGPELQQKLSAEGFEFSHSQFHAIYHRAREDFGLLGKPTRRFHGPHIPKVKAEESPAAEVRKTQVQTITHEQVIDSIAWMASELKELRALNARVEQANDELLADNKVLRESNHRLSNSISRYQKATLELEIDNGASEKSLTGKKSLY